jgi:hypothetical protein
MACRPTDKWQPLLGSSSGDTFFRQRENAQWWKRCFLCGPCRGYITRISYHYERVLRRQWEE